ncbi:MAG: TIGR02996 domain-containing protein [Planctomycetia bacterium]|nr:TIGR02996 domain-containing protein [Planctomycetia bacterium]
MSDRDALLAAILANPDEDTPRLVYADWLDEHGDAKDKKHAQLIRAQCELAKLDKEDPSERLFTVSACYLDWQKRDPVLGKRVKMEALVSNLHMSLRKSHMARLPEIPDIAWDESFNCGFIGSARFQDGKAFAERAAEVCRAAPLRSVTFRELSPADAALVANSPYLSQVHHLTFFERVNSAVMKALASTDRVGGVESLHFHAPTADALAEVAGSTSWSGITVLGLLNIRGEFHDDDRVLRSLAGSRLGSQLKCLWPSASVTSAGLRAMAKAAWPELRGFFSRW